MCPLYRTFMWRSSDSSAAPFTIYSRLPVYKTRLPRTWCLGLTNTLLFNGSNLFPKVILHKLVCYTKLSCYKSGCLGFHMHTFAQRPRSVGLLPMPRVNDTTVLYYTTHGCQNIFLREFSARETRKRIHQTLVPLPCCTS